MGKMCPLLTRPDSDVNKDQQWECMTDTCAWYIYGKCAIVIIAEANDKEDAFGRLIRD